MNKLNKKTCFLLCSILSMGSMAFSLNGAYLSRMGRNIGSRLERIGQRDLYSLTNFRVNSPFLRDYHAGRRGYSSWNRAYVPNLRWTLAVAGLGGVSMGVLGRILYKGGLKECLREQNEKKRELEWEYLRHQREFQQCNEYLVDYLRDRGVLQKIKNLNDCIKNVYQEQIQHYPPAQRIKALISNFLLFDKKINEVVSHFNNYSGEQVIRSSKDWFRYGFDVINVMIINNNANNEKILSRVGSLWIQLNELKARGQQGYWTESEEFPIAKKEDWYKIASSYSIDKVIHYINKDSNWDSKIIEGLQEAVIRNLLKFYRGDERQGPLCVIGSSRSFAEARLEDDSEVVLAQFCSKNLDKKFLELRDRQSDLLWSWKRQWSEWEGKRINMTSSDFSKRLKQLVNDTEEKYQELIEEYQALIANYLDNDVQRHWWEMDTILKKHGYRHDVFIPRDLRIQLESARYAACETHLHKFQ